MRQNALPLGHAPLPDRKLAGAHYTPPALATFVAKQLVAARGHTAAHHPLALLDPSAGDGELLFAAIHALLGTGCPELTCTAFDTDLAALDFSRGRLKSEFPQVPFEFRCEDFLDFAAPGDQTEMFVPQARSQFDLVIANPPYVRTQALGSKQAQLIARRFGLSGRVDLYFPFILGIAQVLRPGGLAGVIVSNRFMTTRSGASVRAAILRDFDILHIWDLGDTRIFEAAVLPAVLLLRRHFPQSLPLETRYTSIYSAPSAKPTKQFALPLDALEDEGPVSIDGLGPFAVQQGALAHERDPSASWRIANQATEAWLAKVVDKQAMSFGTIGKVRVGVKTTADSVFIGTHWDRLPPEETPELLRPLITHHAARRYCSLRLAEPYRILYPHESVNGKRVAVDLSRYPRSAQYLERHRGILEKREYLHQSRRNWYEIWVPQDPRAWAAPKLVFRDISASPTFWADLSGAVVNGDCYWISCGTDDPTEVFWLALAIANSDFVEAYYDRRFQNRLYAQRRRFMTQYVEAFPLPDPSTVISREIIRLARHTYDALAAGESVSEEEELNQLAWRAFGLLPEEVLG